MSRTSIEWTHIPGTVPETWNPTTGCNKVSAGCKNCYAEVMHKRLTGMGQEKYSRPFLEGAVGHYPSLQIPFKWKKPRTVFVNSMSDLFHINVSVSFIDKVFAVMALNPQHTFIILTKRPELMVNYFYRDFDNKQADVRSRIESQALNYFNGKLSFENGNWPLPNVWLGVSCENQETANERIPLLIKVPAAIRFLSCEPLLGTIDLTRIAPMSCGAINSLHSHPCSSPEKPFIDWVIAGGESGHKARPVHPNWIRRIQDQCHQACIPFFFKQWGEYLPIRIEDIKKYPISKIKHKDVAIGVPLVKIGKHLAGRLLDGKEYNEFPKTEKK